MLIPMERLLDVLRQQLGLTGAKEGCGEGECGSCSVLMDGALVNSCLVPVLQAQGCEHRYDRRTGDRGDSCIVLQEAFLDCGGAQCGICTPGMILAAAHLLKENPNRRWMKSGKGFPGISAAAPATARSLKPWRKRRAAGRPHEIQSLRLSNWSRPAACRRLSRCWQRNPGVWLPIAGGTDVMVQYAAGKLPARKLVSIWNLPELRRIEVIA